MSDPATTVFYDSGLAGGRQLLYRVSALDASGRSARRPSSGSSPPPNCAAGARRFLPRGGHLVLNWRDVSGETGYRVERAHYGSTSWRPLAVLGLEIHEFHRPGSRRGHALHLPRLRHPRLLRACRGDRRHAAARPGRLAGQRRRGASVSLRWDPISFGREYIVERSPDGLPSPRSRP